MAGVDISNDIVTEDLVGNDVTQANDVVFWRHIHLLPQRKQYKVEEECYREIDLDDANEYILNLNRFSPRFKNKQRVEFYSAPFAISDNYRAQDVHEALMSKVGHYNQNMAGTIYYLIYASTMGTGLISCASCLRGTSKVYQMYSRVELIEVHYHGVYHIHCFLCAQPCGPCGCSDYIQENVIRLNVAKVATYSTS